VLKTKCFAKFEQNQTFETFFEQLPARQHIPKPFEHYFEKTIIPGKAKNIF